MGKPRNRPLRAGDRMICPHCGEDTIVKIKARMEGWQEVGQAAVCALCGHELERTDVGVDSESGEFQNAPEPDPGVARVASFFGTPLETNKPRSPFLEDVKDVVFCKDCCYFYRHPFGDMCLKHQRPAKSMDDCSDFVRAVNPENQTTDGGVDDGEQSDV